MKPNRPLSEGLQFGTLTLDPVTRRLTAAIWNLKNENQWSTVIDALK